MRTASLFVFVIGLSACGGEPDADPMTEARAALDDGRWRVASIQARNAITATPDAAEPRRTLGLALLALGDHAGAAKELRLARSNGDDDPALVLPLVESLFRSGELDAARGTPLDGLTEASRGEALAYKALAAYLQEDVDAGRAALDDARRLAPNAAAVLIAEARVIAGSGLMGDAAEGLTDWRERSPDTFDAEAAELLGDLRWELGEPERARAMYDEAIEHGERVLEPLRKRAQLTLESGDLDAARADTDALKNRGVKGAAIDMLEGGIALREGRLLEAQTRLEEALTVDPPPTAAIGGLSMVHLLLGNDGQASQYAKQLASVTQDSPAALRLLALTRLQQGEDDATVDLLMPVVRYGPPDQLAMRLLVSALLRTDRPVEAQELVSARTGSPSELSGESSGDGALLALERSPARLIAEQLALDTDALESIDNGQPLLDERQRQFAALISARLARPGAELAEQAQTLAAAWPADAAAQRLAARVLLEAGQPAAARTPVESALGIEPDNESALRTVALIDAAQGQLGSALEAIERAAAADAPSLATLLTLAELRGADDDPTGLRDALSAATAAHPDAPEPAILLARLDRGDGQAARALERLRMLPDARQRLPPVQRELAAVYQALDRHEDALTQLDALLRGNANDAAAYYARARSYGALQDEEAMRRDLEAALEADPNHRPGLFALGRLARLQGDSALTNALRARLAATGADAELLARFDRPARSAGDAPVAAAGDAGDETVDGERVQIRNTRELLDAAASLWDRGLRDQTIALMTAWLERVPGDVPVRNALAARLDESGRAKDAIAQYDLALAEAPDDLVALNNSAWLQRETASDRAMELATRAVGLAPDNASILDTFAVISLGAGKPEVARDAIERALQAPGGDHPSILWHAAQIAAANGDDDSAVARLETLLDESFDGSASQDGPARADVESFLDSLKAKGGR